MDSEGSKIFFSDLPKNFTGWGMKSLLLTYGKHQSGHPRIIHRDIKGANILIENNFDAKVADFGLAKFNQDTNTCFYSCDGNIWEFRQFISSGIRRFRSINFVSYGAQKHGLQLFEPKYPSFFTNHEETETSLGPLENQLKQSKVATQGYTTHSPTIMTRPKQCALWQVVADALLSLASFWMQLDPILIPTKLC